MKMALASLMIAVAMAAAVEDPSDQFIKICDDDLLKALQQACEQKSVEYLLKHGQYDPENDKKYQHRVHHNRDHDHGHNHGHNHGHYHGHDRSRYYSVNISNVSNVAKKETAEKKEIKENDRSIAEECCHKPCLVKDFVSYCG